MAFFYLDILSDDKILTDEFPHKEIVGGMLWEVDANWAVKKRHSCADSDTDEEDFRDPKYTKIDRDQPIDTYKQVKVIDLVDKLGLEKLPPYDDEKAFLWAIEVVSIRILAELEETYSPQYDVYKQGLARATKFLLAKFHRLEFFCGLSFNGSLIYAHYKDDASDPTFLYFAHSLKRVEVIPRAQISALPEPQALQKCPHLLKPPSITTLVYLDVLSGDRILSEAFPYNEIQDGMLWEVEGKWLVRRDFSGDGDWDHVEYANPIYTKINRDAVVDEHHVKEIDLVAFYDLEARPPCDHAQLLYFMKVYTARVLPLLDSKRRMQFIRGITGATQFLLSMVHRLQFFTGMRMRGTLIFSYYKQGTTDPTFLYLAHGLKEDKQPGKETPLLLLETPSCSFGSGSGEMVYFDLITGEAILSDSFPHQEMEGGVLWEVDGKQCDIQAAHVEDCDTAEVLDRMNKRRKVNDIVDTFSLKELPAFDCQGLLAFINEYSKSLVPLLDGEKKEEFLKGILGATVFLFSKLNDLRFFTGQRSGGALIFAYCKDGASDPTFMYFAHGLKGVRRTGKDVPLLV